MAKLDFNLKHAAHQPTVVLRVIDELKLPARGLRRHSPKQVTQIAASIGQFGVVVPILIGSGDKVLAGSAVLQAATALGMAEIPTISAAHLSDAEQGAFAVAHNRLAELSRWDEDALKSALQDLHIECLDFDLEIVGFEGAELDKLLEVIDPDMDESFAGGPEKEPVSREGDVWVMGDKHRLVCGDATNPLVYASLMTGGELARAVITDCPYNLPIDGFVATRGQPDRREFAMASGEMSSGEFEAFLTKTLSLAADYSIDGSIHYTFMDWRHLPEILAAGAKVYAEQKQMLVWVKDNAGMGPFYRSQHELVLVWKKGKAAHLNTFGLGGKGRYRTNVLSYPGASGFGADRAEALEMHPTVKPVALIADLIRDVTRRGDIVIDPFAGSGTLVIAAHKTGRVARMIEIDPLYVDVICRRWKRETGQDAILESTGEPFEAIATLRNATGSKG